MGDEEKDAAADKIDKHKRGMQSELAEFAKSRKSRKKEDHSTKLVCKDKDQKKKWPTQLPSFCRSKAKKEPDGPVNDEGGEVSLEKEAASSAAGSASVEPVAPQETSDSAAASV